MPQSNRFRLGALLVLLAAGAVYANTLSYGAAWDDTRFVFQSGATEGVGGVPDLLLRPYLADVPPARSPYRPATAVSYAVDWSLGGGQASFFHWTNVLLHVGVTGILLAVLTALGIPRLGVLAGGLWFAVHPVHVEAVANLAGRAELLAAFFGMASVLCLLRGLPGVATETGARQEDSAPLPPRPLLLVLGIGAFALALGSKENAVVVLPILALVAALRGARASLADRFRPLWYWGALVAVAAGYMLLRRSVLGTFTTVDVAPFIGSLPPETRVATAVANVWHYLRLMMAPLDLVVDYGPAVILPSAPLSLPVARGFLVLAAAAVTALLTWRWSRLPALGLLWFAVAVFPVSNVLVPIAQWVAERFLYLPSVGAALVLAAVAPSLVRTRAARRSLGTAFGLLIVLFAARSWTRNTTWRDTQTVAATLVREHPEAFRAQWLLGSARLASGDAQVGMEALDSALALNPGAMELHLERARWLLALDRAPEAEEALAGLPAGMHPDRAAHLTRALAMQGRREDARDALEAGLASFPAHAGLRALRDSLAEGDSLPPSGEADDGR